MAEVHHVIGDVEGRTALIVDDIVDTAGTLAKVAEAIKAAGAREVLASLLPRGALRRTPSSGSRRARSPSSSSPTRSRSRREEAIGKIVVLSIAELLAKAIRNIHEETSVTSLFV